jgi:hypothetical protein
MPYKWVPAPLFLRRKGIRIYHVMKDDMADGVPRTFWYSWTPDASDDDPETSFDVRSLAAQLGDAVDLRAVYTGDLREIKRAIRLAVDRGILTQDGVEIG